MSEKGQCCRDAHGVLYPDSDNPSRVLMVAVIRRPPFLKLEPEPMEVRWCPFCGTRMPGQDHRWPSPE